MGIYERDYARPGRGRGGFAGGSLGVMLRRFSVVQWVVILNVAVFMLDALIGARSPVLTHMGTYTQAGAPADTVVDRTIALQDQQTGGVFFPVRERTTGQIVGQWRFTMMQPLQSFGHFSTAKGFVGLEVWRFISFQFLHGSVNHLVFNMIGLWMFGPLVENFLRSGRKFLAYYLICGMCGALVYLILNLAGFLVGSQKPFLLFNDIYTPLIGASAGVFGVLMASAFIAGDGIMLIMFVLPLKIRTGAYLMFLLALGNLFFGGSNAGGDAAHVGGAIAGYFFIRHTHLLADFFDFLGPRRGSGARARGSGGEAGGFRSLWRRGRGSDPEREQQRLDAILEKVRASGLHSLTEPEKRFLRAQTDQRRGRSEGQPWGEP